MCCFTGPVLDVKTTRIFARALAGGAQLVVYDMAFAAASELAMVLPIPVAAGRGDDAVRFVDLSNVPLLFDRLDDAFGAFRSQAALGFGAPASAYRAPPLVVHRVGAFEASYVPTADDFGRLDPRFRLDASVIAALGARASYGFVIVKLEASHDVTRVHPIAFAFPSRDPSRVFFPTVHVHDGRVHVTAAFDHALYTTDAARAVGFESFGVGGGDDLPASADVDDPGQPAAWLGPNSQWHFATVTDGFRAADDFELIGAGATLYRRELSGARMNEVGFVAGLFQSFSTTPPKDVDVVDITEAERPVASGAVFRVHARGAKLRGPSERADVGSMLCGLVASTPHDAIRALHSARAVDEWAAAGGQASEEELAWLRRAAE